MVSEDFAIALELTAEYPDLVFGAPEETTRVDGQTPIEAAWERGRAFGAAVGTLDGYEAAIRDLREALLTDFSMPPAAIALYLDAARKRGASR